MQAGHAGRGRFSLLHLDLSFRKNYSLWPSPGLRECGFEILGLLGGSGTLLENMMPGNHLWLD